MTAKKWHFLHPRTSTKGISQASYVEREIRKVGKNPATTTPEFREWLVRQAAKKGLV